MTTQVSSSWISSILYRRAPDNTRWIGILTHDDTTKGETILLYGPNPAAPLGPPSWLPGLLKAGISAKAKGDSGRSVGRAYTRLLRGKNGHPGKWGYAQTISEPAKVAELKRLMTVSK